MKKSNKKDPVFEPGQRKSVCGKGDIYWFTCSRCGVRHVAKYQNIPCTDCLNDPEYQKEMKDKDSKSSVNLKKYRDAIAFGQDTKTGEILAVDKKGRKFDPMQTRYAQRGDDPHGWKATGKYKPKKFIVS